ncbi:hypothetical protein FACS189443_2800 [Planctomycetales bacterium]|nr:hypothetical protein FACS189443_2800 [Planctomycetales bacterium]
MGGFYNSLHIRNKTQQEIIDGIKSLDDGHGDCIVGTKSNDWVRSLLKPLTDMLFR